MIAVIFPHLVHMLLLVQMQVRVYAASFSFDPSLVYGGGHGQEELPLLP
ncbi:MULTISPECIES: hypothetical protein [Paenibacillus]|nr:MULTISPECIES: hypothetical protein [Paenibacillus]MCM3698184.1 hypothetical protein [Paenibacillus macerans]